MRAVAMATPARRAESVKSGVLQRTKAAVPVGSHTLRRLRMLRLVTIVLLLAWASFGMVAALQSRAALVKANRELIPQVAAAEQMKTSLAAMDAATAEQLSRPAAAKGEQADVAEENRTAMVRALIDAAETGTADREALASMEIGLGAYGRLVQRVRDLRDREEPSQWTVYRQATAVLDEQLEPQAETMEKAGNQRLTELVRGQERRDVVMRALFLSAALLAAGILVAAQMYLSRRTRRTINPGLLAATLLCLVATGHLVEASVRTQGDFHHALAEAYPAERAGWQARSAAAAAKDMDSRAALDRVKSRTDGQAAAAQRAAVAVLPPELTGEQLLGALREGRTVEGFHGSLADELLATHQPGERDAVLRALAAWIADTLPQRPDAAPVTVARAAQTRSAQGAFEHALGTAVDLHQSLLQKAVVRGLAGQTDAELLLATLSAVMAGLVWAGFAPRIREYK